MTVCVPCCVRACLYVFSREIPSGAFGLCSVLFRHMEVSTAPVPSQQASAFTWLYYLLNIFRFFLQRFFKGCSMWPFLCWEVKWWLLMLSALNTCLAPRRSPGSPKRLVTIKLLPKSVPESGLCGLGMRRTVNLCVFRSVWVLSIFVWSSCFFVAAQNNINVCFMCYWNTFVCLDVQPLILFTQLNMCLASVWDVALLTRSCPRQEVPW